MGTEGNLRNSFILEERWKAFFSCVYSGGKGVGGNIARFEENIALGVLAAFEAEIRELVRGEDRTLGGLVSSIRESVERGIRAGEIETIGEIEERLRIFKDERTAENERKRADLAAKFVRSRIERSLEALREKGAEAAFSYGIREAENARRELSEAEERYAVELETERNSKRDLENRFARLNGTLQEAIRKFSENRAETLREKEKALREKDEALREKEAATNERDGAFAARDAAVAEKTAAEAREAAAKKETAEAKRLYWTVAKAAKEAGAVAEILKNRGYGDSPISQTLPLVLRELDDLKVRLEKANDTEIAFQRATGRTFELERQVFELQKTIEKLGTEVRDAEFRKEEAEDRLTQALLSQAEAAKGPFELREDLASTAREYFSVMARMEGSDPMPEDYAAYDRLSKLLGERYGLARSAGCDSFLVATREMESEKSAWLSDPKRMNANGLSKIVIEAVYEKCVLAVGRIAVPKSVQKVADALKFYDRVAGIVKNSPTGVCDAEFR